MPTRKGHRVVIVSITAVVGLCAAVAWALRDQLQSWLRLRRDFESLGRNAQGYDEFRHRQTNIVFVSLPGGTFLMGSPEDEDASRMGSPESHRYYSFGFRPVARSASQPTAHETTHHRPPHRARLGRRCRRAGRNGLVGHGLDV